jgi:predicted membrane channel-forming protein YqfA (hemolysin III family)
VIPFALLFSTSAVPTFIAFSRETSDPAALEAILAPYRMCFFSIFTGSMFFACRIPERWVPRLFDIVGQSHQIFHILVVLGVNAFHRACLQAFHYRHEL